MKKVISLLLAAAMTLSSFTLVFAAETPTVTIGDVDATAIADNGSVVVPVTIDKLPEGKVYIAEINFSFDTTKLQYAGYTSAMKVWQTNYDPDEYEGPYLDKATWNHDKESINRDGGGALTFMDMTKGEASFTTESINANKILVKLKFTKVAGATGTTEVGINNVILCDAGVNPEGNSYTYIASDDAVGSVNAVPGTVTFTSGPKDVKKVVGYYTGDKTAVGNDDESDKTAAVYAELNGDANTNYKKVNWTVTVDETEGKYTQAVDVTGEATYKFGLVIRGLAADVIDAVDAALAQ